MGATGNFNLCTAACHFQFFTPARGFDLPAFGHFCFAGHGLQARLQGPIGLNKCINRAVGFLLNGQHRALQQSQPLWIQILFRQPFGTGLGYRIQQLTGGMIGIHEEALITQCHLQQRQFQAIDQCISNTGFAQIALQLVDKHHQQIEGVMVGLRQRHPMPLQLARLCQQDLPVFIHRIGTDIAGAHPLQPSQHVVMLQELADALVTRTRAQLAKQAATLIQ